MPISHQQPTRSKNNNITQVFHTEAQRTLLKVFVFFQRRLPLQALLLAQRHLLAPAKRLGENHPHISLNTCEHPRPIDQVQNFDACKALLRIFPHPGLQSIEQVLLYAAHCRHQVAGGGRIRRLDAEFLVQPCVVHVRMLGPKLNRFSPCKTGLNT